jgi:hypothetical protein
MAQTATTSLQQPLLPPSVPWFNPKTGAPTLEFARWATTIDAVMRAAQFGALVSAANDAAAKAAGVPVNGLYHNGSNVLIRVT